MSKEIVLNLVFDLQRKDIIHRTRVDAKNRGYNNFYCVLQDYERTENFNVFITYAVAVSDDKTGEGPDHFFSADVLNNDYTLNHPEAQIFCVRGVIGSHKYSIKDVKEMAKNFLNSAISQL